MKKFIFFSILLALTYSNFLIKPFPLNAEENKILRVGVTPSIPPIQFYKRNDLTGLEIDFAKALGKELNRDVEFIELKFRDQIPNLTTGQIDIIMAGMSITRLRALQIAFAEPYMKIGQMALIRKEEADLYKSELDVINTNKKVGALENTTGEYLLLEAFHEAPKNLYANPAKGSKDLLRKKIDLLIMDSPFVVWEVKEHPDELTPVPYYLTEEKVAWGINKDNTELLTAVNQILSKWKSTGELNEMIGKWVPDNQ